MRVPTSPVQVRAAIEKWRGNVKAAAAELGIKPDNLRKRLLDLGIDLRTIRVGGTPQSPLVTPMPPCDSARQGGHKSSAALYPGRLLTPTFATVSSTVSDFGRRMDKPIRVQPEHGDRIRSGRRRLSAEADTDLDDTQLLAEFIEEGFEDWLKGKLEAIRQARSEDVRGSEKP